MNKKRIKKLLKEYIKNPTQILFINDVSMYLQAGSIEPILSVLDLAETFIANGYYGGFLAFDFNTGVSEVEKKLMETLAEKVDLVIRL